MRVDRGTAQSETVIDVIQSALETDLDPHLIANVHKLTLGDLLRLRDAYARFASDFTLFAPAPGEFWPLSDGLTLGIAESPERSESIAEGALQRVMGNSEADPTRTNDLAAARSHAATYNAALQTKGCATVVVK